MRLTIATDAQWPGSLQGLVGHPSNYQALRNNRKISSLFPCANTNRLVLYRGNERRASNPKPNKNMNQKVKILSEENGVSRVTEINGARRGDDLFIDRSDLGKPGDIIEVPEFWVEDFEGDAAKTYYKEEAK